MDSHPPNRSRVKLIVGLVLGILVFLGAAFLLPLYDCPMCGNPANSGFRACYCNSSGKVNLIALIRFPSQRKMILEVLGYCARCEKRRAIGRLNVPDKDGTTKLIHVCGECAKELMPK